MTTRRPTERALGLDDIGLGGARTTVRVVLDTNTVLDWLVFGDEAARAVGAAITQGALQWLTTPHILAELRTVLSRPLSARWELARELALTIDVALLATICAEPPPAGPRLLCRDSDDQVFVDLAHQRQPAVLLTRDRALLALRRRASTCRIEITSAAAWHRRLNGPPMPRREQGASPVAASPMDGRACRPHRT